MEIWPHLVITLKQTKADFFLFLDRARFIDVGGGRGALFLPVNKWNRISNSSSSSLFTFSQTGFNSSFNAGPALTAPLSVQFIPSPRWLNFHTDGQCTGMNCIDSGAVRAVADNFLILILRIVLFVMHAGHFDEQGLLKRI